MTVDRLVASVDELAKKLADELQQVDDRQARGVFFTPPDVASELVHLVVGPTTITVVDPACGGGVFLLAAGRELVEQGVADPGTIARHYLYGADVDQASVDATRHLLATWAEIDPVEVEGVVVGDPLHQGHDVWPDGPDSGFDAVVGNPPFLGQLRSSTMLSSDNRLALRQRYPDLMAAYTDVAWLFLVVGLNLLAEGGRMVLIQPQSILAARDAGPIRDQMVTQGRLTGLWWDRSRVFDGHAGVCAPVVERSSTVSCAGVGVFVDRGVVAQGRAEAPLLGETWGGVLADALGVPPGPTLDNELAVRRLGSLAGTTAGFRQHFYGLVAGVAESTGADDHRLPMVTTASVDPLHLRWSETSCRFNGRRWRAPVVDLAAVAAADADVGKWFDDHRRPKLLVASQTSVVEVVVDLAGDLVPVTPLVVVEPVGEELELLWQLAAALSAPVITALAVRQSLGAARSAGRLRLSATQIADLPLPSDFGAWSEGSKLARGLHRPSGLLPMADAWWAFGQTMTAAYGVADQSAADSLVGWWWSRHPARHNLASGPTCG